MNDDQQEVRPWKISKVKGRLAAGACCAAGLPTAANRASHRTQNRGNQPHGSICSGPEGCNCASCGSPRACLPLRARRPLGVGSGQEAAWHGAVCHVQRRRAAAARPRNVMVRGGCCCRCCRLCTADSPSCMWMHWQDALESPSACLLSGGCCRCCCCCSPPYAL